MSEEEFYALHLKMDDSILITDIHGTVYARELDNEKLGSNYDYRMHYFFFEKEIAVCVRDINSKGKSFPSGYYVSLKNISTIIKT